MSRPIVTLGVCVRNCASTLSETIESITIQDYPHELMEVIFVDDGSEDETLSIIKDYASKMDMKVKIFHHKWRGLGASRNVVVNNAKGKYIIWIDGDMVLPPDHVRKQIEFMEKNPRVGIGKARYGIIYETTVAFLENIPFVVADLKNELSSSKLPGTGGAIFRVKAIRQICGFDERLKGVGEDQDVAYRIRAAGWRIEKTSAIFFEKRPRSWRKLWRKYFWYGYGNYFLYRKNNMIFRLYKMIPPTMLLASLRYSFFAYQLTRSKVVFLLPLHFVFKSIAWFLGFIKASFQSRTTNSRK